jgi:AraC-like DNA-binding protein
MKIDDMQKLAQFERTNTPEDYHLMRRYLMEMGIDPNNLYQELEMSSRFVNTHRDVSYSNAIVNLHSHDYYEMLYCRTDCGVEYLIGSNRYRLQRGDIVVVPPGVSHRPIFPEKMTDPYIRDVLWVSPEFVKMLKDSFPSEDLHQIRDSHLIRTAGTRWEFLGDKFRQGVQESETKNIGWEAALVANTIQLIVQLRRAVQDRTAKEMKAEKPELLDRVMAYIEENLAQKISLAEVSKHFYVSESTVSQLFRKKMGVSFYRCVTQRRLISAKNLIQRDIPLESVAEQTGFSDYSTFYRAFKIEFGISPRQYRLQYANTEKEKHP